MHNINAAGGQRWFPGSGPGVGPAAADQVSPASPIPLLPVARVPEVMVSGSRCPPQPPSREGLLFAPVCCSQSLCTLSRCWETRVLFLPAPSVHRRTSAPSPAPPTPPPPRPPGASCDHTEPCAEMRAALPPGSEPLTASSQPDSAAVPPSSSVPFTGAEPGRRRPRSPRPLTD